MKKLDTNTWDKRVAGFYSYWLSLYNTNNSIPRRAQFDPTEIHRLLPWVWMVDVEYNPYRFKFRLMGSRNVEAMGRDVTGEWIDVAYPKFPRSAGYKDYLQVVETAQPSYRKGQAHYHIENFKNIERVMVPMTTDGQVVDLIAAITIYH